MGYLVEQYVWFLLITFVVGVAVGWHTSRPADSR